MERFMVLESKIANSYSVFALFDDINFNFIYFNVGQYCYTKRSEKGPISMFCLFFKDASALMNSTINFFKIKNYNLEKYASI